MIDLISFDFKCILYPSDTCAFGGASYANLLAKYIIAQIQRHHCMEDPAQQQGVMKKKPADCKQQ